MTRSEAIDAIIQTWIQRDDEFCCSTDEKRRSIIELYDAFVVLDVRWDELPKTFADKLNQSKNQ